MRRSQLVTTVAAGKNHFLQSQPVGCCGDAVVLVVWWIYMLGIVFWYGCVVVEFSGFGGFRVLGFRVSSFWFLVFGFWFSLDGVLILRVAPGRRIKGFT